LLQSAVFNLGTVYGVLSGIGADAKALLEVASDAFVVYAGKFTVAGRLLGLSDNADRVIEKYRQAGEQIREFLRDAPLERLGEMISSRAERYEQALRRAADPRTPQLRHDWEAGVQTGELVWSVASLVLGVATGVGAAIKGVASLTRVLRAATAMSRSAAAGGAAAGLSTAEASLASRLGESMRAAIRGLPRPVTFEGRLYRAVGDGHDPLLVHPGNVSANHRYTGPGQGGLYFGRTREVVEAEFVGNNSSLAGKTVHVFDNQSIPGLLDLTSPAVRESLGVSLADITRRGGTTAWRYEITQPLGRWAQQNGYSGIIAPSAQASGVNVIVFNPRVIRP
jgi:RES domain-containing protein